MLLPIFKKIWGMGSREENTQKELLKALRSGFVSENVTSLSMRLIFLPN